MAVRRVPIALGVAVLVSLAAAAPVARGSPASGPVLVARVIDGDTIQLASGERVRLIGVDTPETKHPQKPVERFGHEASAFTKHLVEGKRVRLEFDQERRDKYGRTLAYVFLGDGTFVNAEIIRQGYGFAYTRFPFRHLDEFRRLEREARESGRGLWATSDVARPPVPAAASDPWPCPADRPIKGNRTTRSSECIYHMPGGRHYLRTKPEDCFATDGDASAVGCRRSKM
jgi:micrococcal nuclease